MKHADMVLSGRVQYVGLRHQVQNLANKIGVAGHVKNLDNGTVEVVCEGSQEGIDSLIEGMRALERPVEVEDIQTAYSDVQGLDGFRVILGDMVHEIAEGSGTMWSYTYMWQRDNKHLLSEK